MRYDAMKSINQKEPRDQIPGNDKRDPTPLLVTAKQAAAMCGRSIRTWRSWDAGGRIPKPVRIGRATFWRVTELETWVASGCPSRQKWEANNE